MSYREARAWRSQIAQELEQGCAEMLERKPGGPVAVPEGCGLEGSSADETLSLPNYFWKSLGHPHASWPFGSCFFYPLFMSSVKRQGHLPSLFPSSTPSITN